MSEVLSGVFIICFLALVYFMGDAMGSDSLRLEIINQCKKQNPDMAHTKIHEYCVQQFEESLGRKYVK